MQNLIIIKDYHSQLWDEKNIAAIDTFFSDNAEIHSPVENVLGTEKMKAIITEWFTGFPDLMVTWDDFICDENKVVSRWHAQGSHQGEFLGISATQRAVAYSGITIYQLDNEKINQYWALVDMHTLMQQLAAV